MEANTKHTPGPWKLVGPDRPPRTIASESRAVAKVFFNGPEEQRIADGQLIAATPDLLAALETILWKLERKEQNPDGSCSWAKIDRNDATITAARAAIAKAKGTS